MNTKPPSPPHPAYPGVDIPPLEKRKYERPVAWLLGRQLISSFKSTLLYVAFKSRIDARDWMHADEYPHADQRAAEEEWKRQGERNVKEKPGGPAPPADEFWFDYISDTGDGMRATYSLAYLSLSDLWVEGRPGAGHDHLPDGPLDLGFMASADSTPATTNPDGYANRDLNRDVLGAGELRLPRGQFLLIGGDTAYHLSDYESLDLRFKAPFAWAFHDLVEDGRMWKDAAASWDELRRPLLGIPANHDYYDQLDGFRRQFLQPVKQDVTPPENNPFAAPQLMLPGFRRCQHASYLALRLPFDWQLWGLDTDLGKLDERQRNFFRRVVKLRNTARQGEQDRSVEEGGTAGKLIVVTSSPTTVFGKYADKDDEKSAKAFLQLGLSRPFLDPQDVEEHAAKGYAPEDIGTTGIEQGQCRLDLSGDIHLYARYWGPETPARPRRHSSAPAEREHNPHYASVVSGIGGAFHHPSTTYAGEIREQALYPPEERSRAAVAARLLSPLSELPWSLIPSWNIIRGGGVWAIGFALAFLIYYGLTFSQSSSQAAQNFPPLIWSGVFRDPPPPITRTVATSPSTFRPLWGPGGLDVPPDYWGGIVLLLTSLPLIFLALYFAEHVYGKYQKHEEVSTKAQPESELAEEAAAEQAPAAPTTAATATAAATDAAGRTPPTPLQMYKTARGEFDAPPETESWYESLMFQFQAVIWPPVALSALALVGGALLLSGHRDLVTPFGNSLLVLFSLVWAGAAVFITVRYTDWLGKMTSKITIKPRYWVLAVFLSVAAAFSVLGGYAVFGLKNTAADMLADVLLVVLVGFFLLGLTWLGATHIGEVTEGAKGRLYALGGGLIGFFHAVLQLVVPFLLVRKGSWQALVVAAVLLAVMPILGWRLMRRNRYKSLLAVWVVYGLAMLALPYLAFYLFDYTGRAPFLAEFGRHLGLVAGWAEGGPGESPWRMLWACVAAGLAGLLLSCAWVAWYFGVALLYHGHNNEAGGAARIENFKQFIRFRVTADDITGFVIAVDEPQRSGRDLKPRLVDMFRLRVKG